MRLKFISIWLFFLSPFLFSQTFFEEGEGLFLENKPNEARIILEDALNSDPDNETIYLYLGIIYEQLNDPEKSISIMRRGLNVASEMKNYLYYNMGNNYFKLEQYTLAEEMYSSALETDNNLADAYLNRANTRIKINQLNGAAVDYTLYLKLEPQSSQRDTIEKLIQILNNLIIEEEKTKQEELEKQQALMNSVLNSLKNASEDTKNLSAESADIEENYEEIDIED